MAYLGVDLGTSGIRTLLLDQNGVPLGSSVFDFTTETPQTGWSEQDPQQWITGLDHTISDLANRFPDIAQVRAIAVAGHMHGAVLLDVTDKVIRPCILWNDTRSHVQAAKMDADPAFRDITGNIVFPGFTAPKLAWVAENEPDHFSRVTKVLLPAAYVNHFLTGRYAADMSDSAGTSWLDVGARDWSADTLEKTGLAHSTMPQLFEGTQSIGPLRNDLAKRWGMTSAPIVAAGAGDNAAAACGMGCLSQGQGFVSLGTSGVLLVARDGYAPAPETAVHTFCHAVPDKWYQMGVILSATASLNWLAKISCKTPAELTSLLGSDLRGPSDVAFLPYLSGERTPHNSADLRGSFDGLSTGTDLSDMVQAVLEGVAFALRDCAEALKQTGAQYDQLFAIGGGCASTYWVRLIATVLNTPLALPRGAEFGAALGAARLAIAADQGATTVDQIAAIMTPPSVAETVPPMPELVAAYQRAYDRYRALAQTKITDKIPT